RAEPDLVEDEVLERALRIALLDVGGEGVVKVRADRPARAGRRERVARATAGGEELLAGLRVGRLPGAGDAAGAAAGSEERHRREPCPQGAHPVRPFQPCGTPMPDTASSRVG